jgi:hypothetical protein
VTSAIRLGSSGNSYYDYLLYVSISLLLHESADGLSQEAVHSDSAFHIFRLHTRVDCYECKDRTEGVYREACKGKPVTPSSCLIASVDV